jgi:RimJ/RimL family protein N-acetyltransferase
MLYHLGVVMAPTLLTIEDSELLLRPFGLDDVDDVTEACQDPEIPRWTAMIPSPYTADHARSWISTHDHLRAAMDAFPFAMVEPTTGRLLGSIGLQHVLPGGSCEVGYWVAAWGRNRGLATRALRLVSDWAFTQVDIKTINLVTMIGNVASERVAQKAGYLLAAQESSYSHPGSAGRTFEVKRWTRSMNRLQH